ELARARIDKVKGRVSTFYAHDQCAAFLDGVDQVCRLGTAGKQCRGGHDTSRSHAAHEMRELHGYSCIKEISNAMLERAAPAPASRAGPYPKHHANKVSTCL